MMRSDNPRPVYFTCRGDVDVVTFNFFRMCFGPAHSFFPDKTWEELNAWSQHRPAASHSVNGAARPYYLLLAVQPPAAIGSASNRLRFFSRLFTELREPLFTIGADLLARGQQPLSFSDADPNHLSTLLRAGRVHCLAWCTTGVGWEPETSPPVAVGSADAESIGLAGLLALVPKLRMPPQVTIVCLEYGAQLVARQLADAGLPLVLYVQASLDKSRSNLLYGVLEPVLRALHRRALTESDVAAKLIENGRSCFGSEWKSAGCFRAGGLVPAAVVWEPPPLHSGEMVDWVETRVTDPTSGCAYAVPEHVELWQSGGGKSDGDKRPSRIGISGTTEGQETPRVESLCIVAFKSSGAVSTSGGPVLDLLDLLDLLDGSVLAAAIETVLPGREVGLVQGLYRENGPALRVNLRIESVAFLHELRDAVLAGAFEIRLLEELLKLGLLPTGITLRTEKTAFARIYEHTILALDALTTHQHEALQALLHTEDDGHLLAPAGAGKTFVATAFLLGYLCDDPDAVCLFVARNVALCYFVVRWMCSRKPLESAMRRRDVLERLHVLYDPLGNGPHTVEIVGRAIHFAPCRRMRGRQERYDLVVVDEAHHIYNDAALIAQVDQHVRKRQTRRLLLSDISQATATTHFPKGLLEVKLNEVRLALQLHLQPLL